MYSLTSLKLYLRGTVDGAPGRVKIHISPSRKNPVYVLIATGKKERPVKEGMRKEINFQLSSRFPEYYCKFELLT